MNHHRKKGWAEQPLRKQSLTKSFLSAPSIRMSRDVRCQIMCTIGALSPETGGILLGPIGSNDITDFYFDATAVCSYGTYTPDHVTLRHKMKEVWMPSGIDMKGFVHSHPGGLDRLSQGDLEYIRRLLQKNPDMAVFAAPVIIPEAFRLRAIVVLADQPSIQRPTNLQLF
jgi:proteasome lid subunit RPN8/RPN11